MAAFDEIRLSVQSRPMEDDQGESITVDETRITINGRDLLDLIREAELPHAQAEGHADLAGSYLGLPPELAFAPSQHLLGRPDALYSDLVRTGEATKPALLVCECGEPGCWPLCARIEFKEGVVVWKDFEQPHRRGEDREWTYDGVGPFTFERRAYESAVSAPRSGDR